MNTQIKKLIDRIDKLDTLDTEEITKTSLIMPFFTALGYDTTDPEEFIPEVVADIGNKKGEKIDYCINVDGKPTLAVECKKFRSELAGHVGQLHRYFPHVGAKIGVLTNGNDYWFFSDTEKENIMDIEPYLKIRLSELTDTTMLEKYRRENIGKLNIKQEAIQLIDRNKLNELKECLQGLRNGKPSARLMRILMNEFNIHNNLINSVEKIISNEIWADKTIEKSIDKTKSLVKVTLKSRKASAQAIFDTEVSELTVLAGAKLGSLTDSPESAAARAREKYKDDVSMGVTTKDIIFKTPSGAAGFVQGNGMSGWKVCELEDGRLLDDIRPNKGRCNDG